MSRFRDRSFWALVGLGLLGLLAAGLSIAAFASGRSASSGEATGQSTFDFSSETETAETIESPEETQDVEPVETADNGELITVIAGDSNSLGEAEDTWLQTTAEELGWGSVVNLSAPGRGYSATPRECADSPCAPFPGMVQEIAELEPDVVVTFGGVADGDVPLTTVAAQYFSELREALPDAQIIAISPVYSGAAVPNWAPLHRESIRAGVEAADGTFVDVGQPSLGDGDGMSADAHAELAQTVIDNLQG